MYKVIVKQISKQHRGVFAAQNIKKGEVIEICHVVVVPYKDKKFLDKTHLFSYYFHWGKLDQPAIALGFGSLYNHSYNPNADYTQNTKRKIITFRALKNIKKGEEIKTNYNGEPDDKRPLWFKVKEN